MSRLAREKAVQGFLNYRCQAPVLGADTLVSIGQQVFGKPSSYQEAVSMLRELSGRVHSVYTAVAITDEIR